MPPAKRRLHLDADTSIKALFRTLRERGHDVSRTPNQWMSQDADDQEQLLGATAQGRSSFTFNVRDFIPLASLYPRHGGILLAHQRQFTLSGLVEALDRALNETQAEDWAGQVRWLSDWRS